eukprot:NODE_562_length_2594_cov_11.631323_g483_i0.p1 GENE.NODE_562_length_2594_cov_11.631323_g483_i0~~NODE_562_length_2594_cov_11.631323_g483_i0.p1  ORF type:complete len:854 (-),score=172.98 NODE_562_length_2594_cov_11.631323_g483_i0:32-2536(-)
MWSLGFHHDYYISVRIIRLLRILRVRSLFGVRSPLMDTPPSLRFVKFIFWACIGIHGMAMISLLLYEQNICESDIYSYLSALETTVISLLFGVPESTSYTQWYVRVYGLLVGIIGVAVGIVVQGRLIEFFVVQDPYKLELAERRVRLESLLETNKVPWNVHKSIIQVCPSVLANRPRDFNDIVELLPSFMTEKLWKYMKISLLRSVPMFGALSDRCMEALALCLQNEIHPDAHPIICIGEQANAMYFINHGMVEMVVPDGKGGEMQIASMSDGQFFGEIGLLSQDARRTATVRAVTVADLFKLDKTHFRHLLQFFPEFGEQLQYVSKQRLSMLRDKAPNLKNNTDTSPRGSPTPSSPTSPATRSHARSTRYGGPPPYIPGASSSANNPQKDTSTNTSPLSSPTKPSSPYFDDFDIVSSDDSDSPFSTPTPSMQKGDVEKKVSASKLNIEKKGSASKMEKNGSSSKLNTEKKSDDKGLGSPAKLLDNGNDRPPSPLQLSITNERRRRTSSSSTASGVEEADPLPYRTKSTLKKTVSSLADPNKRRSRSPMRHAIIQEPDADNIVIIPNDSDCPSDSAPEPLPAPVLTVTPDSFSASTYKDLASSSTYLEDPFHSDCDYDSEIENAVRVEAPTLEQISPRPIHGVNPPDTGHIIPPSETTPTDTEDTSQQNSRPNTPIYATTDTDSSSFSAVENVGNGPVFQHHYQPSNKALTRIAWSYNSSSHPANPGSPVHNKSPRSTGPTKKAPTHRASSLTLAPRSKSPDAPGPRVCTFPSRRASPRSPRKAHESLFTDHSPRRIGSLTLTSSRDSPAYRASSPHRRMSPPKPRATINVLSL